MSKNVGKARIPYHTAIIVENNKLVCWGVNTIGVHAEISALNKLNYLEQKRKVKWGKLMLIVVRVRLDKDRNIYLSQSKPCVSCANRLQKTKISYVCWSCDSDRYQYCRTCELTSIHLSRMHRTSNTAYGHM